MTPRLGGADRSAIAHPSPPGTDAAAVALPPSSRISPLPRVRSAAGQRHPPEDTTLRSWSHRRWLAAAAATLAAGLVLGLPTALVPNPVFARQIAAPAWSYPALAVTAILTGLLLATYVRDDAREEVAAEDAKRFTVGGLLAFFAIGCPTCNKLVLLALGTSGAITWFEPVQPYLAVAGIAVLGFALHRRIRNEVSCPVTAPRV